MLGDVDRMIGYVQDGIAVMQGWMAANQEDLAKFGVFSTGYLGMVNSQNAVELYQGDVRLVDENRQLIEQFDGRTYLDHISEHVEPWTYLKFPYYTKLGWPGGVYRVGPLGQLNAASGMATPLAQAEYEFFQSLCGGRVVEGTLYYHFARLVEDLYAIERARELLLDIDILSSHIQEPGKVTNAEGVGVIEAPRGTLWHHYWGWTRMGSLSG